MKMKHTLALAGIGLAALLAPTATPAQEAQFVANVATVAPDGTPWADQLTRVKKNIETGSQGRIKIKAFMGGAMGNEVEISRDCRRGERIQGVGVSTGALAEAAKVPELALAELPYLFKSNAEADKILDDVMWEPVSKALDGKGFVLVTWSENGWRSLGVKKKGDGGPPKSPAALSAYKMRAQESPVHKNMYAAWGVQYVTTPTSETLPALNTGIVDGFDNTGLFTAAAGLYGPIDYFVTTEHIYQPAAVVFSKKWFDALPADLQTVVRGDRRTEAATARASIREMDVAMMEVIKGKGVEIVPVTAAEKESFASKARPTHQQFITENPSVKGLYDTINAKLAKMR